MKKKIFIYFYSLAIILLFIIISTLILKDNSTEYSPTQILKNPSYYHLFGTDNMGRDFFVRLMYGARNTILIALIITSINIINGISLGTISGFLGGVVDTIIMRIVDALLSLPNFLLAISLLGVFGGGLLNLILFLSLTGWCNLARVIRNEVVVIRNQDHILVNKVFGYSVFRNIVYHIIPNVISTLSFYFLSLFIGVIYSIVSINFLGLGLSADIPEIGNIIGESRLFILSKPYLLMFPIIIVFTISFLLHSLSDELRDYFDNKKTLINYDHLTSYSILNNNLENE